ncbi:helix-turn-helix transcriptional regulator [Brevibacillus choshinensis]|uniref:helix-turn-helix transcriptional regulator n=1 Tax=Brevibacillus choshinensis TaxID=54911 RepID=UPI002E1E15D0|nr:helix-turn-helix transcriptional regulator [Brevibacillus choshinensis]
MPVFKRKEFGGLLKRLRNEFDLSQDELAEELNVSRQTIANTERGQSVPKAKFIEQAFRLFDSLDLVLKYVAIQDDKKELIAVANFVAQTNHSLANRILKKVIREALKNNDMEIMFPTIFQLVMWDMEIKKKVNQKKSEWLVAITEKFAPDPDLFIQLTDELYAISSSSKNYRAFITITEGIMDKVHLDKCQRSYMLGHQANAYYYSGSEHKACRKMDRAIEVMGGEVYKHSAFIYHKQAMICLQKFNFEEALEYELKCLEILHPTDDFCKFVKAGIARTYYMTKRYDEAKVYWEDAFQRYGKNDPQRTHSLNDIVMMEIQLNNLESAKTRIKECESLLTIGKKNGWRHYDSESMLLRRSKALLNAVETNNFVTPEIGCLLKELENSHLKDEFVLTQNFVLERTFRSVMI